MAQAFDGGAFDGGAFEVTTSAGVKTFTFGITESEVISASISRLAGLRPLTLAVQEYSNSNPLPAVLTPSVIKSAFKDVVGGTITLNSAAGWTAAPAAGRVIIMVVSVENGPGAGNQIDPGINFPAGFTTITSVFVGSDGGEGQKIAIAYKVSAGTETTLTATSAGGWYGMAAVAIDVANVDVTRIRFVNGTNGNLNSTLTLSHTPLGGSNNFYVMGVADFIGGAANSLSYNSAFTEHTETTAGNLKLGIATKNDTALNGESVTATSIALNPLISGVLVCFGDASSSIKWPVSRPTRAFTGVVNETETMSVGLTSPIFGYAQGFAGTVTQDTNGTISWSNPSNIVGANNGAVASIAPVNGIQTNDLKLKNFGFAIPSDAIITSIDITATYSNNSSAYVGVCWFEPDVDGTPTNTTSLKVYASDASTLRTVVFGSLMGAGAGMFTAAQVNSASFGVILKTSSTSVATATYDSIKIGINYVTNVVQASKTVFASSATGTSWTGLSNLGAIDSTTASYANASSSILYATIPSFGLPAGATVINSAINISGVGNSVAAWSGAYFLTQTTFNSVSSPLYGVQNSAGNPASYTVYQNSPSVSGATTANLNAGAGQVAISFNSGVNTPSVDAVSVTAYYYLPKSGFNINKNITLNIAEFVSYVISSIGAGEKLFSLTIAEAYGYVIAAARNRKITLTDAQVESLAVATVNRARRMPFALSSAESLSSNFGRTRNVQLSVVEAETIVDSLVRSRKINAGLVESIVYSINTLVPPFTLFAFTIAEAETYVLSALRQRKITLSNTEVEALAVTTLARLKQIQSSVIETEVLALPMSRARTTSFSIAEIEALASSIVRARKVASTINELEVIGAALSVARLKSLGFSLAEIEALAVAIKRTRNVKSSVSEVIVDALNVVRNRKVVPSINESEVLTSNVVRARASSFAVNESEVITANLARLKQVALALGETFGYSFSTVKLKALTAAINEIEGFSFGNLRRTRQVVEAINEVISFAESLSRLRLASLSIQEYEVLVEAIKRSRAVKASLNEIETVNLSLARKKLLATTISEIETISVNAAKLKMMSYVIQQTQGDSFWLSRARKATLTINELEATQASFNRARAYVLPIGETENFTVDIGRLRSQAMVIAETQGLNVALNRVREVIQSIANATGYTFELRKSASDPAVIRLSVTWEAFETVGDNQVLKTYTEELFCVARETSTNVLQSPGSTLAVVNSSQSATLSIEDFQSELIVPNNTF